MSLRDVVKCHHLQKLSAHRVNLAHLVAFLNLALVVPTMVVTITTLYGTTQKQGAVSNHCPLLLTWDYPLRCQSNRVRSRAGACSG